MEVLILHVPTVVKVDFAEVEAVLQSLQDGCITK